MPGFKISWEIQNKSPPMKSETEKLGHVIETPNFRGPYQPDFFENDHIFEATLKVPENLSDEIGKGSLVIEVEVDLIEDEGIREEVQISRGGPKVFKFHYGEKSWYEAEAFCQSMGGNLASIQSDEELQKLDYGYDFRSWIGGIYVESLGTWRWSDGSSWVYSAWESGDGDGGSENECVSVRQSYDYDYDNTYYTYYTYYFYNDSCSLPRPFVCQTTSNTLRESANFTFTFPRGQIPLTFFNVGYKYAASALSQQKLTDQQGREEYDRVQAHLVHQR